MKLPEIIFENDAFLVLNKPAGLLSVPDRMQSAPSLKDLLIEKYGSILTVHRLDRDTSGVILFAKNEIAHKYFSLAFEERMVEKIYRGIVLGEPIEKKARIEEPIAEHGVKKGIMTINKRGKPSITGYEVMKSWGRYSLLQFELFTGRTHQIRVHMKFLGHPIVCDDLYGDGKPVFISSLKKKYNISRFDEERPILGRLGLHAEKLAFNDPDGKRMDFSASLPKDMRALIQQLDKGK